MTTPTHPAGQNGPRPTLIPQPRTTSWGHGTIRLGSITPPQLPDVLASYRSHIERLLATIPTDPAAAAVSVTVVVADISADVSPEGYELRVDDDGIHIAAADAHGALHAVRTLVDLCDATGDQLPHVEITDHPTYDVRGVFTESFAGTDLMERTDWQRLIDQLGQLKFNTLGLSIYGCWDVRHDNSRAEYLFLPLDDFPQLSTQQRVITWDPDSGQETVREYLPRIFADDLFGELVSYAAEQGIELLPHLGGPGHSTLLPRVIPQLSALDDDGKPTAYGYCVSRPEARAALAALVENLVRQHLTPNGVRRLHVAGDEYYPVRNVDPDDRLRVVSPYCRCTSCRDMSAGELLMEYMVTVGHVLDRHGISMVHWQDTLVREGVLDEYRDRIAREGLPEPVISWWKYNDPVPVADASGGETWVSPTTGLFGTIFGQDFSPNIETALRRGRLAGATGTLAYSLHSPVNHQNYACLADLSWNLDGSGGCTGFQRRWASLICPDDADAAGHALAMAGTITASYPLMMYVVEHILPYFSTAAAGVTTYPDDVIRAAAITQPPLADAFRQVKDTMLDAVTLLPEGRTLRHWDQPTESWRQQALRLAYSIGLFLDVLEAARADDVTDARVNELTDRGVELMRQVAKATPHYLRPAVLREHWGFVREIGPALERLHATGGPAAAESWHAWIV